jgi:hypothetical protein
MLKFLVIGLVILAAAFLLIRALGRRPRTIQPREIGRDKPKLITMDDGAVTAEVGGQELEIDPALLDEVRRLAESGQTIEAIKRLREATGLGLTEAKQIVDSLSSLHPK